MKNLATLIRNGDARFARVWSIVSASLLLATASWSQSLTWLRTPPGGFWTIPTGVSADGSVVVGTADANNRAFRWTRVMGMVDLGTLGGSGSWATGVSADGSVVVGTAENARGQYRAFRWVLTDPATGAGTMYDLGTLGGNRSEARDVSADGRVVVGVALNAAGQWRAFRWVLTDPATGAGTMYDLGSIDARAVSADGSVVVGTFYNNGQTRAFRWVLTDPATGAGRLYDLGAPLGSNSEYDAYDVSADGRVVVGMAYDTSSWRATYFRWVLTNPNTGAGTMRSLGTYTFDILNPLNPPSVSADGSIIIYSYFSDYNQPVSYIWTVQEGLSQLVLDFYPYTFPSGMDPVLNSISPNGRYIVGLGINAATESVEAFLLDTQLVSRCLDSDVNGDGVVDDADLLQVLFDFGRRCN